MEFSVTSVVENLFVQRVRLGREGGVVGSTLLDDSSKRAKGTRSTTDVPRLTADRRRTKTLNRGRWRVVALEWGGKGGGKERSVDLRGVTGWEMPAGPHGHWEQMGIHPAGIYTGWVVSMREEKRTEEVFFAIFSFFTESRVGLFLSWTLRI